MKLMLGFQISRTSFFRRGKQTYPNRLVINFYLRKPFLVFFAYARVTALVVLATTVLCILGIGRLAQVGKTVICSIAVNMVKLFRRKRSGHVKPRQSVRVKQLVVDTNTNVSSSHRTTGFTTFFAFPSRLVPRETARNWVVIHKGFKAFLSNCFSLHGFNYITQGTRWQA